MAKYTGNILTNLGKDLLARAIVGGEVITFTKVELGKGITTGNKEELEALTDSFKVLAITSTAKLDGGAYRVRVAFDNTGITEDTELREIGIFARGEDGVEILYSYCDTDTPDLIPAEGSGILERIEDVITYISNAANVNAVIDQSNVYATIKDLNDGLTLKENKFDKNTGFNLNKTDSTETDSSILVATAKAVKKAWDKALEAIGFTDTNKNAILNNTEQIENLDENSKLGMGFTVNAYSTIEKSWKGGVGTLLVSAIHNGTAGGGLYMIHGDGGYYRVHILTSTNNFELTTNTAKDKFLFTSTAQHGFQVSFLNIKANRYRNSDSIL